MAEPAAKYWAFISYSSHDRAVAKALQRSLETYRIPPRLRGRPTPAGPPAPARFHPVFRDRSDLEASADLGGRISAALADSAYLIVVCSVHAAKSRWVNAEITRFRELHGSARILSIIADDAATGHTEDCFPPALRERAGDAAGSGPIAADLRESGDGRRLALLKLLAAMLGIALDDLARRDAQRRYRRLAAITVASLAALVLTAALATTAWLARNQAERQRQHAEGLIEFMLTDLRKRLEPGGHLDAMDGVGREALKYYSAQNPADETTQSLGRRARALRLMGEISVQRGDLGDALTNFEQASASTAELVARAPSDGATVFNHAQNVFWVGEMAHQRGDLDAAEASFKSYLALAERLVTFDPNNDDWRAEIAYAESALGVLLLEKGEVASAVSSFEQSLAVVEQLATRKPSDVNLKLELGQGHAWLADALEKQGRVGSARGQRLTELALYRDILAADGSVRQATFSTIVALHTLGRLAAIVDDRDAALASFTDSVNRAEALLAAEHDNMDLTAVVAIVNVDRGEALLSARKVEAARAAQRRAAELLGRARSHDATVTLWLNYGDRSTLLAAAIARETGDAAQALRLDESVVARISGGPAPRPNTEPFLALERARLQAGEDLAALGRDAEARDHWRAVIDSLPAPLDRYEPKLLKLLSTVDQHLGKASDAKALIERLRSASTTNSG